MKVLFFSPYGGIWKHSIIEQSLATKLTNDGHDITFMTCEKALAAPCLNMQAHGFTVAPNLLQIEEICGKCCFHSKLATQRGHVESLSIGNSISKEDADEIALLLAGIKPSNWRDFQFLGIDVGLYSSYEFLLNHKLLTFEIPVELWGNFLKSIHNSLIALVSIRNILKHEKFDCVITYNRLYSTNNVISKYVEQLGGKSLSLTALGPMNDMYGRLLVTTSDSQLFSLNKSQPWLESRNIPLNKLQIQNVMDHLHAIFDAKSPWVYSLRKSKLSEDEIRARLGIAPNKKVVLLALSSQDEVFAAETIGILPNNYRDNWIFENQEEWIKFVRQSADDLQEFHFVVRVHPREFPNKREKVLSQNAKELKRLSEELSSDNFTFNFPSDDISLYDFIPFVDKLLTNNSSVALEFAAQGIPIVAHNSNSNTNLPAEILNTANSRTEYLEMVIMNFGREARISKAIFAYRWMYFKHFRLTAPIHTSSIPVFSKFGDSMRRVGSKYRMLRALSLGILKLPIIRLDPALIHKIDLLSEFPSYQLHDHTIEDSKLEYDLIGKEVGLNVPN